MSYALVTKEIEFDAGHRVPDHEGKCVNPHGHRYRVVLCVTGAVHREGARTGMVLDFAEIKSVLQEIHDKFDHGFIYSEYDEEEAENAKRRPHRKWIMLGYSPTAENLAMWCFAYASERFKELRLPGQIVWAQIYETPTSMAQFPSYIIAE